MRNKVSHSEYLAFLSVKYEVDPDKLYHGLISAEQDQKSTCGNLSIECRGSLEREKRVFLLTDGPKVVAQFSLPKEFLLGRTNPFKDLTDSMMLRRHLARENYKSRLFRIADLRVGMRRINLKAKVLEIPKHTPVFTRFGNFASVTNALIADETGTIKLCLWNKQIDGIGVGNLIRIENANVSTFRGEKQLRVGKRGKLFNEEALNRVCP